MPPQSSRGSQKPGRVGAALAVLLAWSVAAPHAGTTTPQVPGAGSAQEVPQVAPPATPAQTPPPGPYVVASDAAVFLFFVRPDREIEFREVVAEMKKAMAASTDDVRKAQAAGWKVFRVVEPPPTVPGAPGAPAAAPASVMYAFVISPAVAGSDYSPATLLGEALGPEVRPIWLKYRDAVTAPATKATLTLVADFAR